MKKVVTSVFGRIAMALLVVGIIVAVAVALSIGNKPSEKNQLASNDVVTIETEEVPLADTPAVEASEEEPAEKESAVASDSVTTESTEVASVKGEKRTTTSSRSTTTVAKATNNETTNVVKPAESSTTNVVKATNAANSEEVTGETGSTESVSGENSNTNNSGSSDNSQSSGYPASGNSGSSTDQISEAEKYYSESGQLLRVIDATSSPDNLTETEVEGLLSSRGFDRYAITYEFKMGGDYIGTTEIEEASDNTRPMYQTYYVSSNNEIWTIFVINSVVMANPVSYNLESTRPVQLIISEAKDKELTSYDYETNKYYVTIPNESAIVVKTIDRIDAETLDGITSGEIDGL